jgi:4-hydroxybenzoate polyprenyltransferase
MKLRTALELGRVSNLPTVWSNCLAGSLLANAQPAPSLLAWVTLAISLMYLGGMFLNDAFDAEWDARFKPERPIVRGAAGVLEVWIIGSLLLALGPLVIYGAGVAAGADGRASALLSALLLAVAILSYDRLHKTASYSPWIMGSCRLLVYITAGLATGAMTPLLLVGGLSLMAYIVGLTYVARSEHLNDPGSWWSLAFLGAPVALAMTRLEQHPASVVVLVLFLAWLGLGLRNLLPGPRRNVPAGVGGLLAGIPLVDATVLAGTGHWIAAGLALAAFVATLSAQRFVSGT